MCGRYEQHIPALVSWVRVLGDWPKDLPSRYNICPTQTAATVDAEGWRERHWSLIPAWSKSPKLKYSTFNARAESLADKATFRNAWKHSQRCVVPASGYFEWTGPKGSKQCHYVTADDDAGLCFAGLWEVWERAGERLDSFTIVTVPAAVSIEWLHHRMPLMLDAANVDQWLTGAPEEAGDLLAMRAAEVAVRPVASPKDTGR